MNKTYLKSIAFSPSKDPEDAEVEVIDETEEDESLDIEKREDSKGKKTKVSFEEEFLDIASNRPEDLKKAIEYALSAIQKGNSNSWAITAGGVGLQALNVGRALLLHGDVLIKAKGAAGGDIKRGRGASKYVGELHSEALNVDKKFDPLFKLFPSISSKPPDELIGAVMEGWEMVSDDESYYGESSLYSFIAGRHNSLLRKFKEAWLGVNEFRDTSIFKDIAEIFVILRGDVGATSENIKNFLNSILLWRATIAGLKIVSGDYVHTNDSKEENDEKEGKKKTSELSLRRLSLDDVRSANSSAVVDARTFNIMIDRDKLTSGEKIIIILYISGGDHGNLSTANKDDVYNAIFNKFIRLERDDVSEFPGKILHIEKEPSSSKVYIIINNKKINSLIKETDTPVEIFKIKFGKKYLKVEAYDLEIYNKIKKIAYSATTSYYTVTTPSGKKVDLSIADMVIGKGYVADSKNKFKPKSLSTKIYKKKPKV